MTTSIGLEQIAAFKHPALTAFQEAFINLLLTRGIGSTDELPDTARPAEGDRQSVPGNALRALRRAHVIDYADDYHAPIDLGIFHGRKRSNRVECKGREVRYYRLRNRGMAEAWLKANGREIPTDGQLRLAM